MSTVKALILISSKPTSTLVGLQLKKENCDHNHLFLFLHLTFFLFLTIPSFHK